LLGLDMLKRHQCCIDLHKNVLRIGTTGTETSFLSERDLPECARLSGISEEDIIHQSRKTAEERDLQEALKNSRDAANTSTNSTTNPPQPNPSSSDNSKPQESNTIMPSDKFTEADVAELVALKFTRDQAIFELRRFDGDKTQATAALFAKSLTF